MANNPHNIHSTALVHPSVIFEGKVSVGAYTRIDAGTVISGRVTIGHHCNIRCNTTLRGNITVGNYVHIYDNVCIEGGRPAPAVMAGSQTNTEAERGIIGNFCWINHGATMHGTVMEDRAAVNLNACCDYSTVLKQGAVLANGSATHVGQVIPANCFAQGVPAVVVKENITDEDRSDYFGLIPEKWAKFEGNWTAERIKKGTAK
jgi:carbonic anhydrase/acetyltransferase-like protein (isoleucine patch superfamily)